MKAALHRERVSIRLWSTLMTPANSLAEIGWLCWLWCNLTSSIQVTHTSVWMAQPRAKIEGSCCRYSMPRTRLILSSCLAPELVVWAWICKQPTPWLYLTVTGTRIRLVKMPSKSLVNYPQCLKVYFNTLLLLTEQLCMAWIMSKGSAEYFSFRCARTRDASRISRVCVYYFTRSLVHCTLWGLYKRLSSGPYPANKRISIEIMLITWPNEIWGCFEFLSWKKKFNFVFARRWLDLPLILLITFSVIYKLFFLWHSLETKNLPSTRAIQMTVHIGKFRPSFSFLANQIFEF